MVVFILLIDVLNINKYCLSGHLPKCVFLLLETAPVYILQDNISGVIFEVSGIFILKDLVLNIRM